MIGALAKNSFLRVSLKTKEIIPLVGIISVAGIMCTTVGIRALGANDVKIRKDSRTNFEKYIGMNEE